MIDFLTHAMASFLRKACNFMRWALLPALALLAQMAQADHAPALSMEPADAAQTRVKLLYWHEKAVQASVEQLALPEALNRFTPLADEQMFWLKPKERVWLRMEIERLPSSKDEHWALWLPLPLIDMVTLYELDAANGQWRSSQAGDRVAVSKWLEPGRYPRFHLDLPVGRTLIYLKVEGSTPVSLPLHLGTEVHAQQDDRLGLLGLGTIMGVLLTLVLVCMVTAYTYRDKLYLLYGLYVLIMVLAVGAYTGLSAYLLWPHMPDWADAAQGVLTIITAGGAVYFIEALLGGRQFAKLMSRTLHTLAAAALPLAVVYYLVSRSVGVVLLGSYIIVVTGIGLSLAARAWRRGDRVGKWVIFAYTPLALAVLLALARAQGWISVSWLVQYGVVVALLIEVPMMMVALNTRSRERHEIQTREAAMTTQDALTGLLAEHTFDDRLKQTLARYVKKREDAAVVVISLVNYESILAAHGARVGEQSILRTVIKLRRVLRDVDTVARLSNSYFGLIIEGVDQRSRITDIGARLVAQGLMPLPGLKPEVTLQFHIAASLLRESAQPGLDIKTALYNLLGTMSRRTRRPIRFLEADGAGDQPLSVKSVLPAAKAEAQSMRPSRAAVTGAATASSTVLTQRPDLGELAQPRHETWSQAAQQSEHSSLLSSLPHSEPPSESSSHPPSESSTQGIETTQPDTLRS
jgi:two-component system, sensor histidine kinase LadS